MIEQVILVNDLDEEIGLMEKMEAHQTGVLHRAFSVLLFNSRGEMLLQKRAKSKYHSGGLWTNACCSHPLPGEPMQDATRRKLIQEMGIDLIPEFAFKFQYRAELNNNLIENELDHVFISTFDGKPSINLNEVEDWDFVSRAHLEKYIKSSPQNFTEWFRLILNHDEYKKLQ